MKITLSETIVGRPSSHANKLIYHAGDKVKVVPADNLPADSRIAYWIVQDGWDDDPYGLAVYREQVKS